MQKDFFLQKLVIRFPFLLLIPFNLAFHIPDVPLINLQRLYIVIMIIAWFFYFNPGNGLKKMFKHPYATLLFISFFILPLISAIKNDIPDVNRNLLFNERYFFVFIMFNLGYYLINDEQLLIKFLKNTLIVFIIIELLAVIEYFLNYNVVTILVSKFSAIPSTEYEKYGISKYFEDRFGMSRITATFWHPIALGVFIASFSLFFLYALQSGDFFKNRIIAFISLFLAVFVIFITGSRTPLFIFLILITFFIRYKKLKYIIIGIPLIALSYISYVAFANIGYGIQQDSGRIILLTNFMNNFFSIGFLGIGLGMFSGISSSEVYKLWGVVDPMSVNLTNIIEFGLMYIPFLFLMIYLFIKQYRISKNMFPQDSFPYQYSKIMLLIFGVNIFVSFFSVSIFNSGNISQSIFWILVGSFFRIGDSKKI